MNRVDVEPLEVKDLPITEKTVLTNSPTPPPLGPIVMMMPEGPAVCHDARSLTCITGRRPSTGEMFVVVVSVAVVDGEPVGTLAQMTAAEVRTFAASLLRGADECEGKAG